MRVALKNIQVHNFPRNIQRPIYQFEPGGPCPLQMQPVPSVSKARTSYMKCYSPTEREAHVFSPGYAFAVLYSCDGSTEMCLFLFR